MAVKNKKQIVDDVLQDYERRKDGRRTLESKWRQNISFYKGEQYKDIPKQYAWEKRGVFNHIGPLVETRLAKLADVLPDTIDEIVESVFNNIGFNKMTEEGNFWRELTGTVFYKVVADNGKVKISVCSPFEIYPDKLDVSDMNEIDTVIHAKKVNDKLRVERWGKDRLTIVNNGELEYDGELPFAFPFVRSVSEAMAGEFFGASVVERAVPVQIAYNAVKNRRAEFIDRLACGVIAVEENSTDLDSLERDGLCPGKIIVYREGAAPPRFLEYGEIPEALEREEERLLAEFATVTGGGDIISGLSARANIGAASLTLINEQEKSRLRRPIQSIKNMYEEVGKKILQLLKI